MALMKDMDPLKANHQILYLHPMNALGASMNLLSFGYTQFLRISLVKEIETLKELCNEFNPKIPPDIEKLSLFGIDQLMNSIRLTICFENLMKSLLLLNGYMIFKLSKIEFPDLYKEQFERPITIFEILEKKNWQPNPKLNLNPEQFNLQIKGILKFTIGMKELLSKNYLNIYKIDSKVIDICKPYFKYRNNLHLYMEEELSLSEDTYENITELIDFVNNHIVRIHNEIIDKLNKGEQYYLKKIDYA